jgi:hypothetical protein
MGARTHIWSIVTVSAVLLAGPGHCQSPQPQLNVPLPTGSLDTFSKMLKDMVLQNLPPSPVFEQFRNWGHQASVPTLKAGRIVQRMRNHGTWQHLKATCPDLRNNLELRLQDLQVHDGERVTFQMHLALPTTVEYRREVWQNGLRVFRGQARARLRIKTDLKLESRIKLDSKGELLPDVVISFKVIDAQVSYDKLVVEHIGPVGGDAARIIGDALHKGVQQWKPSLERDLLAKARAAILKAGDTREVHLSLAKLIPPRVSGPASP